MKYRALKTVTAALALITATVSLTACSGAAGVGSSTGINADTIKSSPYYEAFTEAVELISAYDYEGADKKLGELKKALADEVGREAALMRADADYALGRVNALLLKDGYAYDCYNSAYIYYKDLLGNDAPKTVDARLHLAEFGSKRNMARYVDETENSKADVIYKNMAYCMNAEYYYNLDNKKEAKKYLDKIDTFTKASYEEDAKSAERLYGEKFETASALGRITASNQYIKACESKAAYLEGEKRPEEAIAVYEDELEALGSDLKSEIKKADLFETLANLNNYYRGIAEDNEYADAAFKQNEKIYPKGRSLVVSYMSFAEIYYNMGDYKDFRDYLLKAREIIENDTDGYDRIKALIDLRLSVYHNLQGEHTTAVRYAEEALDIYKALVLDKTAIIGAAYNTLANCYAAAGDTQKLLECYEEAEETYRELGNEIELATTLRNHALILNNTFGRHDEAMELEREAVSIVEQMDHGSESKAIAAVYMLMADICRYGDPEYEKIEEYSKKAFACLENAVGNTDEYYANYYYNYGNYLKNTSRYDEALENLEACEELFKKVYDEVWKYPVDVFFDMGEILYFSRDFTAAKEMLERAVSYEDEAIMHNVKPQWCTYLQKNKSRAQNYLSEIEKNKGN